MLEPPSWSPTTNFGSDHFALPPLLVIFSSVRSSNSHPDLILLVNIHFFSNTPVLNTGLSDPLQLHISKAITGLICWLHVYLMGTTGHH